MILLSGLMHVPAFFFFLALGYIQAVLPAPSQAFFPSGSPSRKLVMTYYPDWVGSTFPPERIDFLRFDWIDFAFAVPDAKFTLTWDDPETSPDLLKRLVTNAHAHGTKVKLSLGGWSGSKCA